ncbi:MAG: hypothetical protein DRH79_09045 [Candidatus Cloacimonadota bacterium]|nr:MAG: hypothetical protein DRH79_09045 [Candidatus Cloacimonadota bacterium]
MKQASYNAPAVTKAVEVVDLLSQSTRPMGLSEIVRALDSNKNMCMRILRTLEAQGWVSAEEGPKYKLSLGLFQIASRPLARLDIVNEAFPLLRELWLNIGVNVYMGIPHQEKMLRVINFESTGRIRISSPVGTTTELCEGAGGMTLLAHSAQDRRDQIVGRAGKPSGKCTFCTPAKLPDALKKIERTKLAIHDQGSFRSLATPVFDHSGAVVAAVASTLPANGETLSAVKNTIGKRLIETAGAISCQMGYLK